MVNNFNGVFSSIGCCVLMHCIVSVISVVGKMLPFTAWSVPFFSFQTFFRNSCISSFSLDLLTVSCFHMILTPDLCLSAHLVPCAATVLLQLLQMTGTQVHICCNMLEEWIVGLFHVKDLFSVTCVSCMYPQAGSGVWPVILQR